MFCLYFPVLQERKISGESSKLKDSTSLSDYIQQFTALDLASCETSSANSVDGESPKKAKNGVLKKVNIFLKKVFKLEGIS